MSESEIKGEEKICSICKVYKEKKDFKKLHWERNDNIRTCIACIEEIVNDIILEEEEEENDLDFIDNNEIEIDDGYNNLNRSFFVALNEFDSISTITTPRNYSKANLYTMYYTKYSDAPDIKEYIAEKHIIYKKKMFNLKKEIKEKTNYKITLPPLENILYACQNNNYKILEVEELHSEKKLKNFLKSYENLKVKYKNSKKLDYYLTTTIAFHGTHPKNWESIKRRGLLIPSATNGIVHKTDPGWYGRGVYFSPTASTAQSYARYNEKGEAGIFVNLLLTGREYSCNNEIKMGASQIQGYDSHISEHKSRGEIIMFEADKILPIYFIKYTTEGYNANVPYKQNILESFFINFVEKLFCCFCGILTGLFYCILSPFSKFSNIGYKDDENQPEYMGDID
eukprot:TRINITY_DN728_c4_g1_i1.p1 TRINITY_DN728_c4_g1~~TRINITY_DN728_c4_g1_i1.p1  ORF type:complete len:397 (+),score=105.90 TRINITY_DN728_c4_g1_i1:125-1315(+)